MWDVMTSTIRRSKTPRVSRFDATARTQIDPAVMPRIDVEPAGPPRVHRLGNGTLLESEPVSAAVDACGGNDEAPISGEGGMPMSVESCVMPTARALSAARARSETLGSRLLRTIGWSLLLWVPVCVWLAVQVRI